MSESQWNTTHPLHSTDISYSGLDNPVVFQDEATLTFKCYFELMMYPFDRQKCFIVFKMKDITEELATLVKASHESQVTTHGSRVTSHMSRTIQEC